MITRFLRKRNANIALPFNKGFARIQVSGNSQTFKYKKPATAAPPVVGDRILTEIGDFLNTELSDRIITG
jgi:hypothetical protein